MQFPLWVIAGYIVGIRSFGCWCHTILSGIESCWKCYGYICMEGCRSRTPPCISTEKIGEDVSKTMWWRHKLVIYDCSHYGSTAILWQCQVFQQKLLNSMVASGGLGTQSSAQMWCSWAWHVHGWVWYDIPQCHCVLLLVFCWVVCPDGLLSGHQTSQ